MQGPPVIDGQAFEILNGELASNESWVYVWLRPGEALTRTPVGYSTVVASHIVDMPLRGMTSEARAGYAAELREISDFLRHSPGG